MKGKKSNLLEAYEVIYANKDKNNLEIRHALHVNGLSSRIKNLHWIKSRMAMFELYKKTVANNLFDYAADYLCGMEQNKLFAKHNINEQVMRFVSTVHFTQRQHRIRQSTCISYRKRGAYYKPVAKETEVKNIQQVSELPKMMFEDDERLAKLPKYKTSIPIKARDGLYGSAAGMCAEM